MLLKIELQLAGDSSVYRIAVGPESPLQHVFEKIATKRGLGSSAQRFEFREPIEDSAHTDEVRG